LLDRRIFRCRSLIKQLRLKRFALLAAAVCFTFGFSTFALRNYCLSKRRKAGTPQIHDFQ